MPFHQEAFKKKQKTNTNKLIWLYRVFVATGRISVAALGLLSITRLAHLR